jgi:integrase
MTVAELLVRVDRVKRSGAGWVARCPAHEDRHASLSIAEGDDGRVLVKCHAGCTVEEIVSALRLTIADLFPDTRTAPGDSLATLQHGSANPPPSRTKQTLHERLAPSRDRFGDWTLFELELAVDDVARWRAGLSDSSRYRLTLAMRQALNAAIRWRYMTRNPAVEAGRNSQPRKDELLPFMRDEIDTLADELGPTYGSLVVFAAESGLRTNEWIAVERRDLDRTGRAVAVQRRASDGFVTPYPKTDRRRVPLTTRALAAIEALPPRLDTPLLFPAPEGGLLWLDNWRNREWYDALDAAGIPRRGPYQLRHTFASEALAARVSIFELSRLMGCSVREIDRTYGHLVRDSEDAIRARLEARADRTRLDRASAEAE